MAFATTTVLAVASLATTAAATGISVYSSTQQAKAQEAAAAENARALGEAAQAREAEAHENTYRSHRDARRQIASLRTRLASSGTQLNNGTNSDILGNASLRLETQISEQARAAQMDARAIRHNATLSIFQGNQASAAARNQAGGTILQGFGSTASKGYNFQQQGAF